MNILEQIEKIVKEEDDSFIHYSGSEFTICNECKKELEDKK